MPEENILALPHFPVKNRYFRLFEEKAKNNIDSVNRLISLLDSSTSSILLRHECCYVLGQMSICTDNEEVQSLVVNRMTIVLQSSDEHVMTKHEAIEALAACQSQPSIELIRSLAESANLHQEIRDTAILALDSLVADPSTDTYEQDFSACKLRGVIDPVRIKLKRLSEEDIGVVYALVMNSDNYLPLRYQAMYELRRRSAIIQLLDILVNDTSSAVLRHEVAFICGQLAPELASSDLQTVVSVLSRVMNDNDEKSMVKHEAAIALGTMDHELSRIVIKEFLESPRNARLRDLGTSGSDSIDASIKTLDDVYEDMVVYESCLVSSLVR